MFFFSIHTQEHERNVSGREILQNSSKKGDNGTLNNDRAYQYEHIRRKGKMIE